MRKIVFPKLPGWLASVCIATGLACAASTAVAQAPRAGATGAPAPTSPPTAASTPAETQPGLTKGEIKALREFKMLDFNGDGKLSRTEVKLFPRLSNAFDDADTDHDGYVSYEEVRGFAVKYRAERDRQKAGQAAAAAAAAASAPR